MDMWSMGELTLPIRSPYEPALAGRLSSDERLARLVSRGSERAFAALYRRHHQALYRYCRSIVRDEDDAQDALQSAMTRALVALRAQERDLAVRPWLFRIAHNEAVSILRRRHPTTALAEELEPAGGLDIEGTLEGRERLATLLADLRALPVRQRSALVMRELSGLSIEEIAGALSTSPGATKQLLFEARRALHEFAEGRAMDCEHVRRAVSDGDRRVLRGRRLRGHLRECASCRDFQVAISARSTDLRALAPPLPGALAAGMLGRLLAHGLGGGHTGGLAVGSGGTAIGSSAAASLGVKALAGVTALTVAVAGGTRLALVHGSHGPVPGLARQGADPAPSGLETAGTTRLATSRGGGAPLPATRRVKGGGIAAPSSTTAAASAHHTTPPSARAGMEPARGGAGAHSLATGYGGSRARGHGGTPVTRHGAPHRPAAGGAHGRSGSSRPRHGAGARHRQAPVQPVKPRRGQSGGERREPPPAPPAPGASPEVAGAHAHAHSVPAATPRASASGEGQAFSTTAPTGAGSG
jgi:RNA polymerase sigma factor (sigma-70 family)